MSGESYLQILQSGAIKDLQLMNPTNEDLMKWRQDS